MARKSDKEWEVMGRTDPYYGVVTCDEFRTKNLTEQNLDEFFKSGESHVAFLFERIRERLDAKFNPARALDFGCGVGRCSIPMASRCKEVVGVDVSESMIAEAQKNSEKRGAKNLQFVLSDDGLTRVTGSFDFIHSFITFQHIPPARGEVLFDRMAGLLANGGVGVHQVVYSREVSRMVKLAGSLRKNVPGLHNIINLVCGKPWSEPLVEKNCYDLNRLFAILHRNGCNRVAVMFEGETTLRSAVLFFQKAADSLPYEAFYNKRRGA